MTNNLELLKNHLYKLIKEELEGGEEEKQAGLEKALYDLVLEPADLESALTALSDIKNYGIYANNLRDPKVITKIFGPSVPATKGRVAKETWDQSSENERLSKVIDIKSRVPQEWAKVEQQLQSKFDDWSIENDNNSFNEFIITLEAKDLPMDFFGKYASTFYPMKTPDNLKKYSGVMAKDKDFVVVGDKIVFPQKKNPFETKDYLTKVLKTIMGNAKLQYSISQQESDDQPATTSNTQGKVEKINFIKTFDTPELAAKFKKLIPKDFAPKTELEGSKIIVSDITDSQKKNLITSALQFIASQPKKSMKEGVKDYFKDPMNAADVRGWIKNPKLSDAQIKDKIKAVMKDPSKFNDLMDEFTKELKPLQKPMKESIKDQIKKAVMEVLQEKKLTKAEKNKKEDIVKAMAKQGASKDSKTYAIATAKAKKLAENLDLSKWKIDDKVEFSNGEVWRVAKPGYKKATDSIFLIPFNDVAQKEHLPVAIEFTKDELENPIRESKAKKLAEGEGDTSMDDILLAFQGALDIQDDAKQDKALKAVYNALKNKVKSKAGDLYQKARTGFAKSQGIDLNEAEEETDAVDTITMDVPLFIRMLEYAREDASADVDLHDVAENAVALNKQQEVLSMDDYDALLPSNAESMDEA